MRPSRHQGKNLKWGHRLMLPGLIAVLLLPAMVAAAGFGLLALRAERTSADTAIRQTALLGAVAVEGGLPLPGRVTLPEGASLRQAFHTAVGGLAEEGGWFAMIGPDLEIIVENVPDVSPRRPELPLWLRDGLLSGSLSGSGTWAVGAGIGPVRTQAVLLRESPRLWLLYVRPDRPAPLLRTKHGFALGIVLILLGVQFAVLMPVLRQYAARLASDLSDQRRPSGFDTMLEADMRRHDLRNGLWAVQAMVGEATREKTVSGDVQTTLRAANLALGQLNALLDDALPALEVVELRSFLTQLAEVNRLRCDAHGNDLKLSLGSCPVWVTTHPTALFRILMNLMDNAAKFTKEGEIKLTLMATPAKARRRQVTIAISDTGPGIPPMDQGAVFAPHQRSASSNPAGVAGQGLGLAVVEQLVRFLGGRIAMVSEPGAGTTFRLSLTMEEAVPPDAGQDLLRNRRIWVVDDSEPIRDLIEQQLREMGAVTQSFHRADALLVALSRIPTGEWPAVVLTDLRMPDFDPATFVSDLREKTGGRSSGGPLVVAHSAHLDENLLSVCRNSGYDAALQKGVHLARKISELLGPEPSLFGRRNLVAHSRHPRRRDR